MQHSLRKRLQKVHASVGYSSRRHDLGGRTQDPVNKAATTLTTAVHNYGTFAGNSGHVLKKAVGI